MALMLKFNLCMSGIKTYVHQIILALVLIMGPFLTFSQTEVPNDSLSATPNSVPDTLSLNNAALPEDSVSSDVVNQSIFYDATDSIVLDALQNKVLLYGDAIIKYETMVLEAAFVEYSFADNMACAAGVLDTAGVLVGKPQMNDNGQKFTQDYLCYNFKTKKGYSKMSVTQEGDAIFIAEESKRQENEWIHIRRGKFTTCDAENPHYHFQLSKAIIIPNDKVVSGPLYLKIRKVPLPLGLPFGWFPTKNESSHGIIIPGYGNANNLGYFLKDGGYYFPIGRFVDTRILGDIYSRGSWSVKNITNYKRRYKYSGAFNISRTVLKTSIPELPDYTKNTEFFIRWNHTQDPKARPNSRFSANINFGTRDNFRNNLNSSQTDFLSNTFTSSIQWNKSFPGTPYNLTVNARHSQNSTTENVDLLLPGVTLNRTRKNLPISTWLGKTAGGKKWYDQIGLTYSATYENFVTEKQQQFRWDESSELVRKSQTGIRHTAALSSQAKIGFMTFTPSFNFNEYWSFKSVGVTTDDLGNASIDTLSNFIAARDWRVSGSFNTRFYGTFNFRKAENIKAIRHVITPQLGVSYVPYANRTNFLYDDETGELVTYNAFDAARFRPGNSNEQFNLNFSMANNLEMKTRDKSASSQGSSANATKKQKIIENFLISGSYNMIADSLNLSDISMRGFTTLFKNVTLNVNSRHSAYTRDSSGNSINTFLAENNAGLLRLKSASAALGMNIRSKNKQGEKDLSNVDEQTLETVNQNRRDYVDFTIPWSLNLNYTLGLNRLWDTQLQQDSSAITQSVLFRGDMTVFKRWKIGIDSGYDLVAGEMTPTTINVYWDLHCWELTFNMIPFGIRQSFSVQLNVKSSLLQDLKLQARGGPGGLLF
ncbi:MAG: hypothetical protein ACI80P_000584 [Flavobacteriales bacterium]|jgi:hypothetical protein